MCSSLCLFSRIQKAVEAHTFPWRGHGGHPEASWTPPSRRTGGMLSSKNERIWNGWPPDVGPAAPNQGDVTLAGIRPGYCTSGGTMGLQRKILMTCALASLLAGCDPSESDPGPPPQPELLGIPSTAPSVGPFGIPIPLGSIAHPTLENAFLVPRTRFEDLVDWLDRLAPAGWNPCQNSSHEVGDNFRQREYLSPEGSGLLVVMVFRGDSPGIIFAEGRGVPEC